MKLRTLTLVSTLSVFAVALTLFVAFKTRAAQVSVCNSGCDFTTITDAVASGLNPTDVITVGADYASSTETFPLDIPVGVTLDCQDSGAIIGTDDYTSVVQIKPNDDSVIQHCQFKNVDITISGSNNYSILNNTFLDESRVWPVNGSNITVSGNTGLRQIAYFTIAGGTIENNTVLSHAGYGFDGFRIQQSTDILATNNLIDDQTTTTNNNYSIVNIVTGNDNITFSTNTIRMSQIQSYTSGMSVLYASSPRTKINGNRVYMNGFGQANAFNINGNFETAEADINHNTVLMGDNCNNCTGLLMTSWTVNQVHVTSTYNIFSSTASSSAGTRGFQWFDDGPPSNNSVFSEYNGFAGLNQTGSDATFPAGPNSLIRRYNELKTDDVDTSNDFEPVPYSAFLDVNGSVDIGAESLSRGSDFHVNAAGTINYTSVAATNTHAIQHDLRDNDVLHLANGVYRPITLAAWSLFTGNASIQGAGAGTVIDVPSNTTGSAFLLDGVSNVSVNNLTTSHASSSIATQYLISHSQFTGYDEAASIGASDAVLVIYDATPGSCLTAPVFSDDTDVSYPVTGSNNWNLLLVNYAGNHLTVFSPNNILSSPSVAEGCAPPGLLTVEHFVPDVFTVSGGVFTYNAAAVASEGVTIKAGDTDPAYLHRILNGTTGGGFAFLNAGNNTITNVTSTNDDNGIYFSGTSTGNVIKNATISGSPRYVVFSDASGDNTLVNVVFDHASSSITGIGEVLVRFGVYAYVENPTSLPSNGAIVTWTAGNGTTSTVLTTDGTGFTPIYTNGLPAFTLTSSSIAETSGGFNPYSVSVAAMSGTSALTASMTVTSVNQLVSLALLNAPVASVGGGKGATGAPGTTNPNTTLPLPDDIDHLVKTDDHAATSSKEILPTRPEHGFARDMLLKLPDDGNPKTQEDTTVYAIGGDGYRHLFPSPEVYFSWYCDFSRVHIVSEELLHQAPLGKNLTYRPGLRTIKFKSGPRVYVVQPGGILRPLLSEEDAINLLGTNWAKSVKDIPETLFPNYTIGQAIGPADIKNPKSLDISPSMPSDNLSPSSFGTLKAGTKPMCGKVPAPKVLKK